jgi:Ca2+-binding EF-hand superfamily protein
MKTFGIAAASLAAALVLAMPTAQSTASEANDTFNARYAAMDLNGDGVVSVSEFGAVAERMLAVQRASNFAALDTDADGRISQSELLQRVSMVSPSAQPVRDVTNLRPVITVEEFIDSPAR